MYEVSVPMALFDFVPVFLFGWAAVLLQRDLYGKMTKYAFACFAAGAVDTFMAGFLKALWKLLYAAGICDLHVLNTMFLPTQSLGLFLTGLGILLMLCQRKNVLLAAAPPVVSGSMVFISLMVLGLGALCAGLSVLASRLKKRAAIVLFVLTFFCYMGMGYLGSRDSTSAAANWIEQSVNCLGQLLLLSGVGILHKAGLRDANI